jgi:hypothetical protein
VPRHIRPALGNSYLLESTLRFLERDYAWTRIENVDRTTELLLGENPEPPGFSDRFFTRDQAYTARYEREVGHTPHAERIRSSGLCSCGCDRNSCLADVDPDVLVMAGGRAERAALLHRADEDVCPYV